MFGQDEPPQPVPYKKWVFAAFACLTLANTAWIVLHVASAPPAEKPSQSVTPTAAPQSSSTTNSSKPPTMPQATANSATTETSEPTSQSQSTDSSKPTETTDDASATYTAIISCGVNGYSNLNVLACFAGQPSTEIELTNGGDYGLYKVYQIGSLGTTTERGLEIRLQHHFKMVAQNSNKTLTLGVRVVEDRSGRQVYGKQVAQFGTISVSN